MTTAAARRLLLPLSWLYGAGVSCRNAAFDAGILKSVKVHVPVISVGNLTAGGTGKTPLVEFLVRHLLSRKRRVGVISRGYGRLSSGVVVVSDGTRVCADASTGGDEPLQMAGKFPGLVAVVGERRVDAARTAIETLGAEILIMDDGFQHRYLERDLNILVVNGRTPLRSEMMLPAGLRREPLKEIRRADVIALAKIESADISAATLPKDIPVVAYQYRVAAVRQLGSDKKWLAEELKGLRVVAFSGIGDPQGFQATVRSLGVLPEADLAFSDHHRYTAQEVQELTARAQEVKGMALMTTEKDAIRLSADPSILESFEPVPVLYPEIEVHFVQGEELLLNMVDQLFVNIQH